MVVFTRYFIALNRASLALTHATSNFIPASKVLNALYFPSFYRRYVTNFYVLNYVIEGDGVTVGYSQYRARLYS